LEQGFEIESVDVDHRIHSSKNTVDHEIHRGTAGQRQDDLYL